MVSISGTSFVLSLFKNSLYLMNILLVESVAVERTLHILLNRRRLLDCNLTLFNWMPTAYKTKEK